MELTKSNFSLIDYPFEIRTPIYGEKTGRDGMVSWGSDNCYPEYLLSLLDKSGKHSAIVKNKSQLIGGNGFNENELGIKAMRFLVNAQGEEDLDSILAKISYDMEIFGCFALNPIWSRDRETIAAIRYVPVNKLRIAKSKEGNIEYWISEDWSNRKSTPIKYQPFSVDNREIPSTIYFCAEYRPGNGYYPIPEYISGVNWIELEGEISVFHLKNIQRGFAPSFSINVNSGIPSPEDMDTFVRDLKRQFSGSLNAGQAFVTFAEDRDHGVDINPIETNNNDNKFIDLNKSTEDGIYQAHRVTNPALFGVMTPGKLGNTQELSEELDRFNQMYVKPKQMILERVFNELAAVNGISEWLYINEVSIPVPIKVSTGDILSVLTSPLIPEVKKQVLMQIGLTEEEATKLVPITNITNPTNG